MSLQTRLTALIAAIGADVKDLQTRLTSLETPTVPIGSPIPWLVSAIPSGYLEFNGQPITAAEHPELYDLFGDTLPDLRDRFLVGASTTKPVGSVGGVEQVTLTAAQSGVPAHSHLLNSANEGGAPPQVVNGRLRFSIGAPQAGGTHAGRSADGGNWSSIGVANSTAANASQAHENKPPYMATRWITRAG